MTDTVPVRVDRIAQLAHAMPDWSDHPSRAEWSDMFAGLAGTDVQCGLVDKGYIVDLYRKRLESAVARGDDGLNGLDRAVALLDSSTEPSFAFAIIPWRRSGFFVWLNRDATRLIAWWRAMDARTTE